GGRCGFGLRGHRPSATTVDPVDDTVTSCGACVANPTVLLLRTRSETNFLDVATPSSAGHRYVPGDRARRTEFPCLLRALSIPHHGGANMSERLSSSRGSIAIVITVASLGLTPLALEGQTGTITGQVTDAQTAQPLASAQVSISELSIGVLTQQNGRFVLVNVPAGTHTINVQRIGYRSATEAVTVTEGQSANQDFAITEEALALDEVIVTGTPGGSQRRAIGNTVATVEAAQITEQVAVTNMQEMLSGRTAGLQFTVQPGGVGVGSPIQ